MRKVSGAMSGLMLVAGLAGAQLAQSVHDFSPVSFTYNNALAIADGELHPPTTEASPSEASSNWSSKRAWER